ncbi:hypothetical protein FRB96_002170 [Tulasnella sp. 330]|nr:hypothetical protein FRB96_002170 [Tulasnella sp. 330]
MSSINIREGVSPTGNADNSKSKLFGTRCNFWVKYDAFGSAFDKEMMESLNTNLDVMLIFAGLFSAINTAFIIVALTGLSANPVDETNHLLRLLIMNTSNHTLTENDLNLYFTPTISAVRQNCIFFASLCCSLLAATGAVLAKQWLQFYGRVGQTGPIEQQAIRRTEKFVDAEKWGLRPVVETLATLLLISLALFFIALVDYLWSVDKTVALVVLVFAAAGMLLYAIMVVVAAIFTGCPFQTGPSTALRELSGTSLRILQSGKIVVVWYKYFILHPTAGARSWPHRLRGSFNKAVKHAITRAITLATALVTLLFHPPVLPIGSITVHVRVISTVGHFLRRTLSPRGEVKESKLEVLHALSVILFAESAPHPDEFLAIAENIPLITDFNAVRLMSDSSSVFRSSLSQLLQSLRSLRSSSDAAVMAGAIILSRAVAHMVLADPKRTASAAQMFFSDLGVIETEPTPRWFESTELVLYLVCIHNLQRLRSSNYHWNGEKVERMSDGREAIAHALRRALRSNAKRNSSVTPPQSDLMESAATFWLRHIVVTAVYNRWDVKHMDLLMDDINNVALLEGLVPDSAYLSRVMSALTAIVSWYSLWGTPWTPPNISPWNPPNISMPFEGSPMPYDATSPSPAPANIIHPSSAIARPPRRSPARLIPHALVNSARQGGPSLDDGANLKDAWNTSLCGHPIADQLLDTLDTFALHHEALDSSFIPKFDLSQKRLLALVNALYPSYLVMFQERPSSTDLPRSLITRMHSRLNWSIETLIDSHRPVYRSMSYFAPMPVNIHKSANLPYDGEEELVRALHRLLLTSALLRSDDQTNLVTTVHLAARTSTAMEKELLLQGILYTLLLDIQRDLTTPMFSQSAELEKRRGRLQEGGVVGLILASTLRMFLRSYPTISSKKAWPAFEKYLRIMAFGDLIASHAAVTTRRVDVWDAVVQIARQSPPHEYSPMGGCTLWLASRGVMASEQLDGEMVVEWFRRIMQESQVRGGPDGDGNLPVETWRQWDVVDRKCAGIVFLEAWQANDTAPTLSQPSKWTSLGSIDAFATWLHTFQGELVNVVDIKLEDVVLMQAAVELNLVTRFVDHVILTNPLAAEECALQSTLQSILSLSNDEDRGGVKEAEVQGGTSL